LFLFQRPTGIGIDLGVLLPTVVVLAAMTMLAGRLARRSLRRKPVDNHNGLIGRQAVAQIIGGNLRVKVDGTSWSTSETDTSLAGRKVVITNIEGLTLDIAPAPAEAEFNKD
jgi:membrane-bound serine protease (ClpP class)